jgi:hypothetical protein
MAWAAVSTDHVLEEFTPAERAALRNIQEAEDHLPAILSRVVALARGNIRASGNSLDVAGTVPEQVALDVIAIARWRWLVAMPQARAMQTEGRKAAHDDAMRRMEEIARGDYPVEPAADVDDTNQAGNYGSQTRFNMRTHKVT